MCKACDNCNNCPLWVDAKSCDYLIRTAPDKANEIILKWCEEHPVKTRQDRFLKMFPNAPIRDDIISLCPTDVDTKQQCNNNNCTECRKEYWLAVDENE